MSYIPRERECTVSNLKIVYLTAAGGKPPIGKLWKSGSIWSIDKFFINSDKYVSLFFIRRVKLRYSLRDRSSSFLLTRSCHLEIGHLWHGDIVFLFHFTHTSCVWYHIYDIFSFRKIPNRRRKDKVRLKFGSAFCTQRNYLHYLIRYTLNTVSTILMLTVKFFLTTDGACLSVWAHLILGIFLRWIEFHGR